MLGLFITGTDTGVGKTHVTCLIAQALRSEGVSVGAYKPACTGAVCDAAGRLQWEDATRLAQALGGEFPEERICPQRFAAALAPPVAAQLEGRRVDSPLLTSAVDWWRSRVTVLLIEGVGGLLSPLSASGTVADLAVALGCPLVIVAPDRLGTINHTLLTVEAARRRGLVVSGVILNRLTEQADPSTASNAEQIAARGGAPVPGTVPFRGSVLLRPSGKPVRMNWMALIGAMQD